MKKVTNGFEIFLKETDGVGPAFMESIMTLSEKSALDEKVHELAYLSCLTATRMYGGLPYHIERAKELGATEEEIKSAILVPLPLVGIQVAEALPYVK